MNVSIRHVQAQPPTSPATINARFLRDMPSREFRNFCDSMTEVHSTVSESLGHSRPQPRQSAHMMRRITSHPKGPPFHVFDSVHRRYKRCDLPYGHNRPAGCASHYSTGTVRSATTTDGRISVDSFRSLAWDPAIPLHLRDFHRLPAMRNWFTYGPENDSVSFGHKLQAHALTPVPYELIVPSDDHGSSQGQDSYNLQYVRQFHTWLQSQPEGDSRFLCEFIDRLLESAEDDRSRFLQFEAPLGLIIRAHQYNGSSSDMASRRIRQLYIAQCSIGSLPVSLSEDLPTPEVVGRVGRGDVYNSSIWLGLAPTYTSLHRDPNPNLFFQMVGSKAVRLLPPAAGLSVFQQVRRALGAAGNSRLRGPEMMEGPERDGLHSAIWTDQKLERDVWQAVLEPGDALFIPQGWWHSVKSVGHETELNASANWWFR